MIIGLLKTALGGSLVTIFTKIDNLIENIIKWIEIILAVIIVFAVIAEGVYISIDLYTLIISQNIIDQSKVILDRFLILVVSLEFAIMLVRKNPFAIIDIFMITIARKVVLEYHSATDYLIAVITFTLLVIIRIILVNSKLYKETL